MYIDRDEVAQLKSALKTVRTRLELFDLPNAKRLGQRVATGDVNDDDMRAAGFDPNNRKHRDGWRRRNDGDCGGSF